MSYGDVVAKVREENLLFSVMLELTYRCNLDCFFCYNDLGLRGTPLRRQQYLDLLDELHELGVLHLVLTGGEPLAHPHFFELGRRARDLRFAVRVKSNGHALRGSLARRLHEEVDPMIVEVSLHGSRAETHDRQTRVAGSFDRLTENLAKMKELGLRLKINSTVTRWNEGELEQMYELADDLGVPLQFDPEVTPRDDGDRSPLDVAPSRDGLLRLFRLQQERARRYEEGRTDVPSPPPAREGDQVAVPMPGAARRYCGAGTSSLTVDPYGNVYPCVQWRRSVGNLHESRVAEIWGRSNRRLEATRRDNEAARSGLVVFGQDAALGSFCPGQAELSTGRADAVPEAVLERIELRKQALAAQAASNTPQGSSEREKVRPLTGISCTSDASRSITASER